MDTVGGFTYSSSKICVACPTIYGSNIYKFYCSLPHIIKVVETSSCYFLLLLRPHVKQQKLCRLIAHALNLNTQRPLHPIDISTVSLPKHRLADFDLRAACFRLRPLAHDDLREQLPRPRRNQLVHHLLAWRQDTSIHTQIRLQPNRMLRLPQSLRALHNPAQRILLLLIRELLRLIMRLQPTLIRLRPDLQKVHLIVLIAVVLGMPNPRPRAGELDLAAREVLQVAHGVLVLQGAVDDVAEDEELGVAVGAEAGAGLDAVFVDDAQRAPALVARVVVRREGEGVVRVQPVVVRVAAVRPWSLGDIHAGWGGGGGHGACGGGLGEERGEGVAEGGGERQGDC